MAADLPRARRAVTGRPLPLDVRVAGSPRARMVGLLGRDALPRTEALVLRPCSMIHTWFMRFAIDVVFVSRRGEVTRCVHGLVPFRSAWGGWRAHTAVEASDGVLRQASVAVGDRVTVEPV